MSNVPLNVPTLDVNKSLCIGCSHCMRACPTSAIRIVNNCATILHDKCIDCGICYSSCACQAIDVRQDDFSNVRRYGYPVALIPAVFLSQFPDDIHVSRIYATIKELGFRKVFEVESASYIYTHACKRYAMQHPDIRPLISGFCPAIVRLIQVRYPSLVENILPLRTPVDISALYLRRQLEEQGVASKEIGLFYVTPCAAKIASVKAPVGEDHAIVDGVISMHEFYNSVFHRIKQQGKQDEPTVERAPYLSADAILSTLTNGERRRSDAQCSYAVDGMQNVTDFLEKLENGEVKGADFLELRACDLSCAGGILSCENRFLCSERMYARARKAQERESRGKAAHDRTMTNRLDYLMENIEVQPIKARPMISFGNDMAEAFGKVERYQQIIARLPQVDCGLCGAPSCEAHASDVVDGTAAEDDCVFVQRRKELQGAVSKEENIERLGAVWGKHRLSQG